MPTQILHHAPKDPEVHPQPHLEIDITSYVCPMTFVRTRLALDRIESGQLLAVRLRGLEPLRNIPATTRELGHHVLACENLPDGSSRLLIRKQKED